MKNLLQLLKNDFHKSLILMANLFLLSALPAAAQVWTYDFPGGEQFSSPDYKVTIKYDSQQFPSFVHYSYGLDEYQKYNVSNGILVPAGAPVSFKNARCTESHSAAFFSFKGSVKVYVTVRKGAKHITLPLKSAKILPSSYNIPCSIINDSTITFTLDRPEKVVVMVNYNEAWKVFEDRAVGHVPVQSWKSDFVTERDRPDFHGYLTRNYLSEGYKNPLFVMALPHETNIPDINSPQTLVVNPGTSFTQQQLDAYNVIWFKPGIHDFSSLGTSPRFQVTVKHDQTIYLEGGSYVYARFRKSDTGSGLPSVIKGRGMISGMKHHWTTSTGGQVYGIDTVNGVTITDRATFSLEHSHHVKDVSLLGAWHGNNDGVDFSDDCLIENCFLIGHDDNLKLNNNTHARHIVIWQLQNAHPIMVKEMRDDITFANCIVEDVDIVAFFQNFWGNEFQRLSSAAIASNNGRNIVIKDFIFRDIRVESPYMYRPFSFYNLDTNQSYAPSWLANAPSSEARHTRINGVRFENITVNSPLIIARSLLGSDYSNSMSNLSFVNININGTVVTEANKNVYFEIDYPKISGLSFSPNSVEKVKPEAFSIHPNPAKDIFPVISNPTQWSEEPPSH
jgi:hypothetical protein